MAGYRLRVLPGSFAVCRFDPHARVPLPEHHSEQAAGFAVTVRTPRELCVVCAEDEAGAEVRAERGFRCLEVAGPLAFELCGVLAELLVPIAAARVPVFVVSSFDTDYLLVRAANLERAAASLEQAGHHVTRD